MSFEQKEGWGKSPLSNKRHYFILSSFSQKLGDNVRAKSLCNKFSFFNGELREGNDDSNDNCTTCKKVLQRRKAKGLIRNLEEGKKIEF